MNTTHNDSHLDVANAMQRQFNEEIIDLVTRTIKPDLVFLFVRNNGELSLVASNQTDPQALSENSQEHRIGECLCSAAIRDGAPVYSSDLINATLYTCEECKKNGVRSFASLPLLDGDQIIGILGIASLTPHDFAAQSMILEPLAAAISISFRNTLLLSQHIQANNLLSKSERRFHQLFEKMTEGVALHKLISNPDGTAIDYLIVDINPAYEKILGIKRDEVLGKTGSLAYNSNPPPYLEQFSSVVSSGKSLDFESFYAPMNRYFNITVLPWEKNGFATIFFDVTEHTANADASKKALGFVETLLKSSPMGIRVFEGDSGRCVMANQAAADIAGGTIEQLLSQNFRDLVSWKNAGIRELAEMVLLDGAARPIEADMLTTFGKQVAAMYFLSHFIAEGKPHLMVIGRNVTDEKRLAEENRRIEAQMLHVQKLESLGVLAGGIAHDFNNILMAILGNAELAMKLLPALSPATNNLREIESAARRAADLAHQMLAYSGKGHFLIESLDINRVIYEMTTLLDVSVSKKATLYLELEHDLPHVKADAAQLSQVIMNLIINASEAIENKIGDIIISTGTMECSQEFFSKAWIVDNLPDGTYVYMKITDTGCGMDKETLSKIYEPFFTTKFTGRGLGMAAVIGIVRGHKGAITVDSRIGLGTTFTVLLPAAKESAVESRVELSSEDSLEGSGTILLVDDEESIRHMGQAMLEMFGFQALTASDGFAALEMFKQHRDEIICVILDLTMPHMDGEQTFTELRKIDPNVRVIMSSGYTEQEIEDKFHGKGLTGFIQKPYQIVDLERKLKNIIGCRP